MKNKKITICILLIAVLAAAGLGVWIFFNSSEKKSSDLPETNIQVSDGWKTFIDKENGFTIRYPELLNENQLDLGRLTYCSGNFENTTEIKICGDKRMARENNSGSGVSAIMDWKVLPVENNVKTLKNYYESIGEFSSSGYYGYTKIDTLAIPLSVDGKTAYFYTPDFPYSYGGRLYVSLGDNRTLEILIGGTLFHARNAQVDESNIIKQQMELLEKLNNILDPDFKNNLIKIAESVRVN